MERACHHQVGSASPECTLSPDRWAGQAPSALCPHCLLPQGRGRQKHWPLVPSYPPTPRRGRAQLPALVEGGRRPNSSPGRSAEGPLHSQDCGLIVQGRGDTGEGGASALDTVGACLLNRLRDCLLAVGSGERERFGWIGARWEGFSCLKHRLCLSGLKILTSEY